MKKTLIFILAVCHVTIACAQQPVDYIDPTIGNVGQLLEPTRPTVQLPNQLIRFAPQRKDYLDDQVTSFPLSIVSHRLGQVFAIRPVAGKEKMTYDHDLEVNRPWYYQTWLIDQEVSVEFTPAAKAGIFRFVYPATGARQLLFGVYNEGQAGYKFPSATQVTGMETYHDDIKVYLYGEFSTPGKAEVKGKQALVTFSNNEVELRYAISFINAEQAKKNFEEVKGRSFQQVADAGKQAWEKVIGQIKVEGGTEAQKRSFYTSLYRCYERMVDISEDGQYYSGYDKKIHNNSRPFYVDDWSWDTYLAHHPLRVILDPAREEDMLQSYVRMYEQSGWMPTFPVLFGDHACMNGFHSTVVFLDAYRKGLRNYDMAKAYEGMRKNALEATMLPWRNGPKTVLDDHYLAKGYFPSLHKNEKETVSTVHDFEKRQAVAVTLGNSYDDWALSQLAGDLGKKQDAALFAPRGQNYKNLWHPQQKMFLPKDIKGQWINIDPKFDGGMGGREYYDENNGYTYRWQVQQDIPGLIGLMGGKKQFEEQLDQLFREDLGRSKYELWAKFPDATGLVGQYSMGNEPSFHIPYLYNFTAAPWKTQKHTRFLLDVWFKDNIFGIPGDEDGGGMTAFVVFTSMGFYPVTPGKPIYTITSPVFSKVAISLPNGKTFRVTANNCSVQNKYIQSAKMDGQVLDTPWFTHEQLVSGGHLELEMGPKPNKTWGTAEQHIY